MWLFVVCLSLVGSLCQLEWLSDAKIETFVCAQYPYLCERGGLQIERLDQDFIDGAEFCEIDTSAVQLMPPPSELRPLRLAVDASGRIYRIMGFDSCEFNDLVDGVQLNPGLDVIYSYGRFYLRMCHLTVVPEPVFVSDVDCLLKLNREIMLDSSTYLPSEHGTWDSTKLQIESALLGVPLGRCSRDTTDGQLICTYVIWFFSTGELHRIDVSMDSGNRCSIVADKVLGIKIGFWNSLKM